MNLHDFSIRIDSLFKNGKRKRSASTRSLSYDPDPVGSIQSFLHLPDVELTVLDSAGKEIFTGEQSRDFLTEIRLDLINTKKTKMESEAIYSGSLKDKDIELFRFIRDNLKIEFDIETATVKVALCKQEITSCKLQIW